MITFKTEKLRTGETLVRFHKDNADAAFAHETLSCNIDANAAQIFAAGRVKDFEWLFAK